MKKIYEYFTTLPERLYPFTEVDEDKEILTGQNAYAFVVRTTRRLYHEAYTTQAPKILIYRELFNLLGSLIAISITNFLITRFSILNGVIFLAFVVYFISLQEFHIHPKYYKEIMLKSIIDWAVWMVPILIYIFA